MKEWLYVCVSAVFQNEVLAAVIRRIPTERQGTPLCTDGLENKWVLGTET